MHQNLLSRLINIMKYIDQLFKDRADTGNIGELLDVACKKVDELRNGLIQIADSCDNCTNAGDLRHAAEKLLDNEDIGNFKKTGCDDRYCIQTAREKEKLEKKLEVVTLELFNRKVAMSDAVDYLQKELKTITDSKDNFSLAHHEVCNERDKLADLMENTYQLLIESMGSEPIEGMDIKQAVILLISQRDNARSKKQSESGNDV